MNYIKDPVLGDYYLVIDDLNYSAYITITPSSGIKYDSCIGHFGNLGKALEKIAEHQVRQKSYTSLKEYIIELKNIYNDYKKHFLQ
jgi:hypothetical protein